MPRIFVPGVVEPSQDSHSERSAGGSNSVPSSPEVAVLNPSVSSLVSDVTAIGSLPCEGVVNINPEKPRRMFWSQITRLAGSVKSVTGGQESVNKMARAVDESLHISEGTCTGSTSSGVACTASFSPGGSVSASGTKKVCHPWFAE